MNRRTFQPAAPAAVVAAALVAGALSGCSEDEGGQKINPPFKKTSAAVAATDPKHANYFEMKKDGKTYVFSKVESMNAFREGKLPPDTRMQQLGGKTVVFEDRNYTDYNRLVAEYKKSHNVE